MALQLYQIVFSGAVVDGWEVNTVKKNLAKLFKADHKMIATLFSGHPVVIKQGIERSVALKYVATLASVGGDCCAQPMPAVETRTAQQIEDQRRAARRRQASRRKRERLSSIQPNRRLNSDRRRDSGKQASEE